MINKKSYFNSTELDIEDPYNMKKWEYVAKIITYDSQRLGNNKALDYHSYVNFEDDKERDKFKQWCKIKKVAGDTMPKLSKRAREQYGLNSTSIYPTDTGSSFDSDDRSVYIANQNKRSDEYQKLYGDLPKKETKEELAKKRKAELSSRINKYLILLQKSLLSSDISIEDFSGAMEALKDLSLLSQRIKTAEMGIDLIYRTSNKLNRYGLKKEASGLKKFAQEQEAQLETAPLEPPSQGVPPEQAQQVPAVEMQPEQAPQPQVDPEEEALRKSTEAEPVAFSDIDTPGPEEGEYDKIIDTNIQMSDAAGKLEDVASMLADRRVIRYLAEFDIMLDKLGIASMFPELAESQSKLIDAYSYALTRVSKMMGQLANAAEILQGMDGVPGSKRDVDAE
jgi:hypothetical protein